MDERAVGLAVAWVGRQWVNGKEKSFVVQEDFFFFFFERGTRRFNCVQYAAVFILYRRAQRT
jgi:hypothetical protein